MIVIVGAAAVDLAAAAARCRGSSVRFSPIAEAVRAVRQAIGAVEVLRQAEAIGVDSAAAAISAAAARAAIGKLVPSSKFQVSSF